MRKSLIDIGKFVAWVASLLGGIAGFFAWLGVKPKDLAMSGHFSVPHALLLAFSILLFGYGIGSSIWAGVVQKIEISRLKNDLALAVKCKDDLAESANRNLEYRAQLAEYKSESVLDSDPFVYPEFTDARQTTLGDKRENQAYFTLVNRGGSEARNIVLEPIELNGKVVQFTRHRIAAPLFPKHEAYFYPDFMTKDNESVKEWEKDLFHLFCLDYLALGDSTICEATMLVVATYQDSTRNLFEVTCELVFDPSAHAGVRTGNRGLSPVISARNHKFRKVSKAMSSGNAGQK